MPHSRTQKGFTLIELLIVIAIIGILSTVLVTIINPLQQFAKARDAGRKSDLRQIANALQRYQAAYNGQYPSTNNQWCGASGSNWNCATTYDANGYYIPGLVEAGELTHLPQDVNAGKAPSAAAAAVCGTRTDYTSYLYQSNGTDYKLLAHCTPEANPFSTCSPITSSSDPFCDPSRPKAAWQISTPGAVSW